MTDKKTTKTKIKPAIPIKGSLDLENIDENSYDAVLSHMKFVNEFTALKDTRNKSKLGTIFSYLIRTASAGRFLYDLYFIEPKTFSVAYGLSLFMCALIATVPYPKLKLPWSK